MVTNGRSFLHVRYRTIVLFLAAAVVLWSAFSYWSDYTADSARRARESLAPPLGVRCAVVFRSQDLGLQPMSPTPSEINGTSNAVYGVISQVGEDWIVLDDSDGRSAWIPWDRILLIRVEQQ